MTLLALWAGAAVLVASQVGQGVALLLDAVLWLGPRLARGFDRAAAWLDRLAAEPDAAPAPRQVRGH